MIRIIRRALLHVIGILIAASSVSAAECYLQIEFEQRISGEYSFKNLRSVFDNHEGTLKVNRLKNPYQHQLQIRNAQGEVLAAYSTGGSLHGVGESFLGTDSDDAAASVQVSSAAKKLYLPAVSGAAEIGVHDGILFKRLTSVTPTDLQCARTCTDAGEAMIPEKHCCKSLLPLAQESGSDVCSRCGDGICSEWESEKNCAVDCQASIDSLECLPGLQTLTDCGSLLAYYDFEAGGRNRARRGNELFSRGGVTLTKTGEGRGAHFTGERSYLSGGVFSESPVASVSALIRIDSIQGKRGVLSFGHRKGEGIVLGLRKGRPYIEIATRQKNVTLNGRKLRRKRQKRGKNGRLSRLHGSVARIRSVERVTLNWNHIALVRSIVPISEDFRWTLLLNGKRVAEGVTNFEPDFQKRKPILLVGAARQGKPIKGFFRGEIDQISIWKRPLSDKEVQLMHP